MAAGSPGPLVRGSSWEPWGPGESMAVVPLGLPAATGWNCSSTRRDSYDDTVVQQITKKSRAQAGTTAPPRAALAAAEAFLAAQDKKWALYDHENGQCGTPKEVFLNTVTLKVSLRIALCFCPSHPA